MAIEHTLEVEQVDIDSIFLHPQNANIGNVEAIKESITVNGVFAPILVSRTSKRIVAGNHTYKALRELGSRVAQVVFLENLSPEDEIRVMLAANRTAQLGSTDIAGMVDLLDILREDGDLSGTGWDDMAYDAMVLSLQPAEEQVDDPANDFSPPEYTVVVACTDAEHQITVLEQLRDLGLSVKPAIK